MCEAAQLQLIVDTATYSEKVLENDAIKGWVSVNLIMSLAELMTPEIKNEAKVLKLAWSKNWSVLYKDKQANQQISDTNSLLVKRVIEHLVSLN